MGHGVDDCLTVRCNDVGHKGRYQHLPLYEALAHVALQATFVLQNFTPLMFLQSLGSDIHKFADTW